MLVAALRQAGYATLETGDPREALLLALRRAGRIDLVIADVAMPRMSGTDAAGAIRSVCPGIPVLFISGYTGPELLRRGVAEESWEFLAKPLDLDELLAKVRSAIAASCSSTQARGKPEP